MNKKETRAFKQEMVLKEMDRAVDTLMEKIMVLGSYMIVTGVVILTAKNIIQFA